MKALVEEYLEEVVVLKVQGTLLVELIKESGSKGGSCETNPCRWSW